MPSTVDLVRGVSRSQRLFIRSNDAPGDLRTALDSDDWYAIMLVGAEIDHCAENLRFVTAYEELPQGIENDSWDKGMSLWTGHVNAYPALNLSNDTATALQAVYGAAQPPATPPSPYEAYKKAYGEILSLASTWFSQNFKIHAGEAHTGLARMNYFKVLKI